MSGNDTKVRVRVSPAAAKILSPAAPRALQLQAARGEAPLAGADLVTVLFFLGLRGDTEVRTAALNTLQRLPLSALLPVARSCETPEQILDFLARSRPTNLPMIEALLQNPATAVPTVIRLAGSASLEIAAAVVDAPLFSDQPEIQAALAANPVFGLTAATEAETEDVLPLEEEDSEGEEGREAEVEEEVNLSKYQLALEMVVSEKIKTALTGDKEWRTIFLKDANKLVCSAVLKNPRITEGEVLAVAKNRSAQEELIRLVNMNREWLKNYEIRRALVMHPRTPLVKALRYMNTLTEKDIKNLAKSRNVAQVIANNARRMLLTKKK